MSDNEIIAAFMGYKLVEERHSGGAVWLAGGHSMVYVGENFFIDQESYTPDSRWDFLMPVVEKIEEIALNVSIETACVTIKVTDDSYPVYDQTITFEWQEDTKLNVLYRSIVGFIKWYNQQKP